MKRKFRAFFCLIFLLSIKAQSLDLVKSEAKTVIISEGKITSFFSESFNQKTKEKTVSEMTVSSFVMDVYPVTNRDLDHFLESSTQFQKSQVSRIFADQHYLEHWTSNRLSEIELKKIGDKPVTSVSWFVARKYCQALGKRLPNLYEWEYAADITNPDVFPELLKWYSKTGDQALDDIGQKKSNKYGLYDMHGLIWEWVEDFNSVMISSDSRSKGDRTTGFYCGGGSVNAADAKQYATFMRYAFRSGLSGNYSVKNLGFRCAQDLKK